ncbi:MAG: DUF5615 family PIN-like protein [Anaerolineales bacterium]|nr:DUF5615 family PIN-like protein [Anaerolineales bacterium]
MASYLNPRGHEASHTLDLPQQNRTPDRDITQRSLAERRVVVTKDADFRDAHLLKGAPYKLLLVATGNITNNELLALFERNLDLLVATFVDASFVELDRQHLTIHQ